jgi:hypothetical protein
MEERLRKGASLAPDITAACSAAVSLAQKYIGTWLVREEYINNTIMSDNC